MPIPTSLNMDCIDYKILAQERHTYCIDLRQVALKYKPHGLQSVLF